MTAKIAEQLIPAAKKIGGFPIEDVVKPNPKNRKGMPLAVAFPEIAAQWYYPKNCGFGPKDFSHGSRVNAWWRCNVNPNHIWRAQIMARTVCGSNCPFCNGTHLRVAVPPERSLAVRYPEVAKELHSTLNNGLTGYNLFQHSSHLVWWQCSVNPEHIWRTSVDNRTSNGSQCPECRKIHRPSYLSKVAAQRKTAKP